MSFLFLVISSAIAYEISIPPHATQCYGEEISLNTLFVCEFSLKGYNTHAEFRITATNSLNEIVYEKPRAKEDKFSFISSTDGAHTVCLQSLSDNNAVITLKITTGVAAKDYSSMPSMKDFKNSQRKVARIADTINELKNTLRSIKERDSQLGSTNETVYNRVIVYSITTLVLLFALALAQIMYLKRFLKSKKMI